MKKIILTLAAVAWLSAGAAAGDITPGSVPGSINYQGRLERDNAPVTGLIHIYFRVYNAASGGTARWTSPEIVAEAAQGIFSANITPPWTVFAHGETLYLEVQVESDVLAPREPLNSVAYSIVAKKLEDGASISVTTLTANYQVLLATDTDSKVGIGNTSPTHKLTINGVIKLNGPGSAICYDDNTCTTSDGVGTAVGGVLNNGDSTIASGGTGVGNMSFVTAGTERMRINDNVKSGRIGIGAGAIANPLGTVDIDGSLYVGNAGIYDRDDGEINVKENLVVEGGRVTGANAEYFALGETDNVIGLVSGGSERMRVHTNGYVGVNNSAPAYPLDVTGDIHTNTGLVASAVSAGAYTGWPSAPNEIRAANATHLLLQQNNSFNVGIGTNTPNEKLHVKGSIRAEKGIIADTAAFSGAVNVNGTFTANSGAGNTVNLSSTVIYGTLQVTGGIGSMAGFPAYLASTQSFTGQNTFVNQITASSDVITPSRLGVAMKDFDFPGVRYLQVGDNKPEYSAQNTLAYIVGGDAANARLVLYRGAVEAGSLETQNGANLAMVVGGQAKTLTDAVYHRIQNSVVWISTGFAGTPAVYVSSKDGNVGIGTVVSDPNYRLTVDGTMHIVGAGNGIVFPNGSVMTSASLGSASSLANSGDALVVANTGGGGGSVVLRSGSVDGLVVDSGGNIGVGTLNPVSKLNVRGGDLLVGTPYSGTYGINNVEDLLVAGSVIFDGALIQRSVSAVQFSGLIVSGDVYLSTGTNKKTGIATNSPVTTLDVNGDAQFGLGVTRSTFTAVGALQLATQLMPVYGGTGIAGAGGTNNRILRTANGTSWTAGQAVLTTDVTGTLPAANGGTGIAGAGGTVNRILRTADGNTWIAGQAALTTDVSGTLPAANGGTGISGAGTVANRILRTADGATWAAGQASLTTDVSGTLPVGNGGTGVTTLTGVVHGNGAGVFTAGNVALGSEVSGTLGLGNGGTGGTTAALARASLGVPATDGTSASGSWGISVTGTAANVTGTVAVGNGGTGVTTLTGVVHGNGAGVFTAGNVALGSEVSGTLGLGNGGTGGTTAALARTSLGVPATNGTGASGSWGISVTGTAANVTGTVAVGNGGTGATDAATARGNLGLTGLTQTINVRRSDGTAACTITVDEGRITATTCP